MSSRTAAAAAAAVLCCVMASSAHAEGAVALPSGRTDYRTLADYSADIAALVAAHPDRVRRVVIGESVEGRPLEGVEIADGVRRTDDGRPVHAELGLTHAREWPSGEMVMELATELASSTRPRLARLRERVRTFLFPVVNPDGFNLSRTTLSDQRKNSHQVDLNRNFGAFWGGPGASDNPLDDTYRGPSPFSEPESQALRAWSATHMVATINSNHTYSGTVLYQPGFAAVDAPGLPAYSELPGSPAFAALAARMARAAGYDFGPAFAFDEITGAAEDFNYFNQFSFAYTTEIGFDDYHGPYAEAVAEQYLDGADGVGVRAAMLRAAEAAADRSTHARLRGRAPAGSTLRITRTVRYPTSYVRSDTGAVGPARTLTDRFNGRLTVGDGGRFRWDVNPSVRPLDVLAGRRPRWTLVCGTRRTRFALSLGQVRDLGEVCG